MALYLNYPLELQKEKVICAGWSNTDIPVLAVGTSKKRITFFQDDAYNLSEHDMKKDGVVTALCWHPTEMILAYGLQSGHVGIWIDEENYSKEELNHEGQIQIIKFNYDGNRIITADDRGVINVWRFAPLYCMCTYKQKSNIDEIIIPHFCIEKMNMNKAPKPEKLATLFFFSNSQGILYLADDNKSSPEICRVTGKIKSILFYERDNAIIIITSTLLLVKCSIHFQTSLVPKKVKLSIAGNPDEIRCCWASEGLIAIVSGDDMVRFYYLETDQGYFLGEHNLGDKENEDSFTCIDFSSRKRMLIVGGVKGKVYMWKCNLTSNIIPINQESWEKFGEVIVSPDLRYIKWSTFGGVIHTYTKDKKHSILSETILQKKINKYFKVLQINQKEIELVSLLEGNTFISKRVELEHTAKGIEICETKILIWNGSYAYVYEVDLNSLTIEKIATLKINSGLMSLNEDSVIAASPKGIDIYSFQGEIKDTINLSSRMGEFLIFYTINRFLLVCTTNNYFGIYDISRRILKEVLSLRKFEKNGVNLGEIREAAVNSKGNLIVFLIDTLINSEMRVPETKFIIFDVELDTFIDYEISTNTIPVEIFWDNNESRVFGIRTEYAKDFNENKMVLFKEDDPLNKDKKEGWFGPEFYMFFYASEAGIRPLETHKINSEISGVFGLEMPEIYFIVNHIDATTKSNLFIKKFQFFLGLSEIDQKTKEALCEFTLLMACGKLDEAYKIVKNIKNDNIWENMAKICIQTKRIDVLEVCLSNMRFQRGIQAFRESKNEKEVEAKLANVAMHLGMIEEAKALLKEVNRWDVLIHFYICIGDYDLAVSTAIENDRINLGNTYYRIAQHYEQVDDVDNAIKFYKLSQCGYREIPRMLIQKNRLDLLQNNIELGEGISSNQNSGNANAGSSVGLIWWASYLESVNDFNNAKEIYAKAKDYTNLIRLYLREDQINEALKLYEDIRDQTGAYLLGVYYEKHDEPKNAIKYYGISGRYNQAFRIAKKLNLDNDIYSLGMKAPKNTQNLIAEYFEKKNQLDRAISLYLLGSNIKKGLNLCLATNQYEKIREISESLETKSDKETLKALAEYFLEQEQQEKALGLFIRIKDYETAMKLCENYKVQISKETAQAMVDDIDREKDSEIKQELTLRLAKFLMQQGEFDLAHGIYVKSNNLKKAMKCLIKMGNKEKVVMFANTCRRPELYILAANFLQNLEWTPELVKLIQSYYNKAKAYLNLATFFENYACVLINERKDFRQALDSLHQGRSVAEKSRGEDDKKAEKIQVITDKINYTQSFRDGIEKLRESPLDSVPIFKKCLQMKMFEELITANDIYNMIFRAYYVGKEYQNAYVTLKAMKEKGFKKFPKKEIIMNMLKATGKESDASFFFGSG